MKKYIDAESLKALLVQDVITIKHTWEDTTRARQEGYNLGLLSAADRLDDMPAANVREVGDMEHEMSVVLADLFGCPLDYDIGEALCEVCDFVKGVLPCTNDDVDCWEQYLKHRKEVNG